uniref:Uncharacterized protein n=1 Tax=Arundo donax TaxID=35708 RepID=A0A0A9CT57_ARUDO
MKACSSWRSLLSLSHSSSSSQGACSKRDLSTGRQPPGRDLRRKKPQIREQNRPQRRDFHPGSSTLRPNQVPRLDFSVAGSRILQPGGANSENLPCRQCSCRLPASSPP